MPDWPPWHDETLRRLEEVEGCMSEIGDAVLGTRRTPFAGGDRREDGLVFKVDELEKGQQQIMAKLSNGGIKVSLPPAVWGFLGTTIAAIIGGIVTLLVRGT